MDHPSLPLGGSSAGPLSLSAVPQWTSAAVGNMGVSGLLREGNLPSPARTCSQALHMSVVPIKCLIQRHFNEVADLGDCTHLSSTMIPKHVIPNYSSYRRRINRYMLC